jgi:acyl carrier protein
MEEKLLESIADILEAEVCDIGLDTEFKKDEYEWDSLKGFAMLVMLEEDFGVKVSVDDFIAAKTTRDLLAHFS